VRKSQFHVSESKVAADFAIVTEPLYRGALHGLSATVDDFAREAERGGLGNDNVHRVARDAV
jgi:hypothetical protein